MSDDETYGDIHAAMDVMRETLPTGVPPPSHMTLRRLATDGVVGTYRLGRNIYFNLDDVRSWVSLGFRRKD